MSDLLSRAADLFPDSVFIYDGDEAITFAEAEREVRRYGRSGAGVVAPTLDATSIMGLLASVRSGGAVLVGPTWPAALVEARVSSLEPGAGGTTVFTSGSIGQAKAACLTEANWEAAGTNSAEFYGFGPGDRWLLALPLHHVGGLSIVYRALCSGGAVVVSPDLGLLNEVEFCSLVPIQLGRILATDRTTPRARSILIGGGPIAPSLAERAGEWPIVRTYGMTETAAVVASASPGHGLGPMWPLPGVELRIDGGGLIEVRGAQVSPGYAGVELRGPDDWFTTSDLGLVHDDGSIEVLGRADRTINSGGVKIDPVAVEAAAGSLPDVGEVAVLGLLDPEWGELVAVIFTGPVAPDAVKAAVRTALGPEAAPRRLLRVERLPRNELGKVDYGRAKELFD